MLKKLAFAFLGLALVVSSMGAVVAPAVAETISDGDLVKVAGDSAVYLVDGDNVRVFPHESVFWSWGYADWSGVMTVSQSTLDSYSEGLPVPFRAGILFTSNGTGEALEGFEENAVFFQNEDGSISPIRDEDAYDVLVPTLSDGSSDWSYITNIPNSFLENFTNFEVGEIFTTSSTLPDGMVVSMDDTTYIMQGGEARELSMSVAEANGLYTDEKGWAVKVIPATGLTVGSAATNSDVTDVDEVPTWEVPVATGNVTFSLSSSTPAAGYVSKGAQNVVFAKFNVVASEAAEIDKIVLQRKGLGYDSDIETIRLYDGATQIGSDQSLNTTTHKVTFNNLNWNISGTKTLTVKANIASSPSGTNDYFEIVEVEAGGSVAGLPVAGNAMEFSALTVNDLYVNAVTGSATVISGATDQELGCFTFEAAQGSAGAAEDFHLESVKFTNTGSASDSDLSNFVLKQGSTEIGTASSMSGGEILVDMTSDPYVLKASTNKRICLYGDIADGITVSKNFKAQIAETGDVVAIGQGSSAQALIELSSGTAFTSQTAKTVTIGQGSATFANNGAYDISDEQVIVKGSEQNKFGAFKITAGADEGIRVTKIRFIVAEDSTAYTSGSSDVAGTDFSNWKLYKIVDGEEVEIPVSGSVSGTNVTFEDTSDGLIDVAKSENETVVVRADVSGSATGAEQPYIYVNVTAASTTNTEVRIQGLDSGDYITDGVTVNSGADDAGRDTEFNLEVDDKGTLTVTKAASSPAAETFAKGQDDLELFDINFYATGEPMTVSALYVNLYEDSSTGTYTDTVDSGDVSNIRLVDEDGDQVGTTCSSPSSGVCSFSFDWTVPQEENTVLTVVADTGTTATYIYATIYAASSVDARLDTTGYYSMETITETISAIDGNLMTAGTPTLTAAMSTSPVATTHITNATEVTLGRLVLSASTAEGVKVTSIKVSADDVTALNSTSSADTIFDTIKLVDDSNDSIQYGITKNFTSGTPDYVNFTGINNLTIDDGESKIVRIVGDVAGTTGTYYFGVAASTDITAVGASSSTDATISGVSSAIYSPGITAASAGSLKVNKAADIPVAAQLVSGTSGLTVMKYKLEGTYEDVKITSLPIYYTGTVADIGPFYLYVDGVQVGAEAGYEFTTGLKTVTFDEADAIIVDKDNPTYLTIKADIRPRAQVTTATTTRNFGIADEDGDNSDWGSTGSYNIVAKGASSDTTITATNIDSLGNGSGYTYGSNDYTLHKGILTASLNASTPGGSGYETAGSDEEVLRFDLTATGDEITVNEMEFCVTGDAVVTGTGNVYLKNSSGTLTYASLTDTEFENYWDTFADGTDDADAVDPILNPIKSGDEEAVCFSFGDQDGAASTTVAGNTKAFTNTLVVAEGDTLTLKLSGDTTGGANPKSLKLSIKPNPVSTCGAGAVSCAATTSGIEWEDSSGTDIDLTTTEGLPLSGKTLAY